MFTIRSAYLMLRRENINDTWKGWKRIWRLKAQERIKVFMWLLAHDKTLTNWSRWHRQISLTACCDRCTAEKEDAIHALRDHKASKEVLMCFIPPLLGLLSEFTKLVVDIPQHQNGHQSWCKMAEDNGIDLLEHFEVKVRRSL